MVGAEKATIYMHIMVHHLPNDIAPHGEMDSFSTQAGEHKGKIRKARAHGLTNARVRLEEVSDEKRAKDGTRRGILVNKDYN